MREIKFRVWDIDFPGMRIVTNVDWDYGGITYASPNKLHVDSKPRTTAPISRCEFMQYTGLKDKNGQEIYEGDIISGPNGFGLVVFDKGAFVLDRYYPFRPYVSWPNEFFEDCEVIGNIHENSELLEQA